jgi:hypothetical protein
MVKAYKSEAVSGECRLCRHHNQLERSHIHPRLAYKRFASENPGAPFLDLAELTRHNRQLRRRWFCRSCEQIFERGGETLTASWLDQVSKLTQPEYEYGPSLHTFAVSLVYRYCLLELEDGIPSTANREMLRRPMKVWREVLLGKKKNIGIYSVHGMLVPADDENGPWEAAVGGQVAYINGLVLTRTGPLILIGLLGKDGFSPFEARQWSATEVSNMGGRMRVVRKSDNFWALTPAICDALNVSGRWCHDRNQQFNAQQTAAGK